MATGAGPQPGAAAGGLTRGGGALVWDLTGIPVIILGGVLLHFCFDWSGRRRLLAVFAPVNESVWEHLKMAYWPLLVLTGVQRLAGADEPGLSEVRRGHVRGR